MEHVWDYPRPPAVRPCLRRVRIELGGEVIADSTDALRVLETSHPPTIYLPPADVRGDLLRESRALDVVRVQGRRALPRRDGGWPHGRAIAWTFPEPTAGYEAIRDHVAFYPGRVDAAWMDDERVHAQEGDFYGGWITSDLVGPFKGAAGTLGW